MCFFPFINSCFVRLSVVYYFHIILILISFINVRINDNVIIVNTVLRFICHVRVSFCYIYIYILIFMLSLLSVYVTISYLYYLLCEYLYCDIVFMFICLLFINSFCLLNLQKQQKRKSVTSAIRCFILHFGMNVAIFRVYV